MCLCLSETALSHLFVRPAASAAFLAQWTCFNNEGTLCLLQLAASPSCSTGHKLPKCVKPEQYFPSSFHPKALKLSESSQMGGGADSSAGAVQTPSIPAHCSHTCCNWNCIRIHRGQISLPRARLGSARLCCKADVTTCCISRRHRCSATPDTFLSRSHSRPVSLPLRDHVRYAVSSIPVSFLPPRCQDHAEKIWQPDRLPLLSAPLSCSR